MPASHTAAIRLRFLARLLLLVLIAVTPLVAVQVYTAFELQREREDEVRQAALVHAQALATELEQFTDGVKQLLIAASVAPPVRAADAEACHRYLRDVQQRFEPRLLIGVLDAKGSIWCRSAPGSAGNVNNSDRYYFREALRSRGFVVGEYTEGRVTGQRAVHMAYPLFDGQGEASGVIVVPVNIEWLAERLARHWLPPQSSVTILDRNGTILVRLPNRELVGRRLPQDVLARHKPDSPAELENLRALDEVRRTIGFVPARSPTLGLSVSVGLSTDVAAAPIHAAFHRSAWLTGLGVLLALGAAWLLGRLTLERPVARLDAAARRWGAGDYAARSGLSGGSELERLGQTFDRMADALAKRELERRQAEAELRRSRDQALQASRAKTHFLAAASHDLRQPLQALGMTVSLLELRHRDDEDTPLLARLARATRNLADLLNTLLDISRLEAGLVKADIRAFAIDELLEDVRTEFEPVAAVREFAFEVERCGASVASDPSLLGRVVRNLLDNAFKFTPRGGSVRISCRDAGAHVVLAVADTGIGIPEEKHAEVFREFEQIDNPERDRSKGLGLGLTIVDRMCALLGHALRLESRVGAGTTFSLELPKADAPPAPPPEASTPIRAPGRVLLVEDNEDVLESTAALLAALGAEVTTARTAEQALATAAGARFDLVLADYRLPGASGTQFLHQARSRWPGVTAALMTGDPYVGQLMRDAGLDAAVIRKPVTLEQLKELFPRQ